MEIKADARKYHEIECDALVIGVFEGEGVEDGLLAELDQHTAGAIRSLFETGEFAGKSGESAYLVGTGGLRARRLLLLGAGKASEADSNLLRKLAGTATRTLRGKKAKSIAFLHRSEHNLATDAQAITEGALLSLFEPDKYHTSNKTESALETALITAGGAGIEEISSGIARGRIIA